MARDFDFGFFKAEWTRERNSETLDGFVITKSTSEECEARRGQPVLRMTGRCCFLAAVATSHPEPSGNSASVTTKSNGSCSSRRQAS